VLQTLLDAGLGELEADELLEWILKLRIPNEAKLRRFLTALEYDEWVIDAEVQAFLGIRNQFPGFAFLETMMPLMAESMELWEIEQELWGSGFEDLALVMYYFNQVFNDGIIQSEIETLLGLDLGDPNDLAFCEALVEAVVYCYFCHFGDFLAGWQGIRINHEHEADLLLQALLAMELDENDAETLLALVMEKEVLNPHAICARLLELVMEECLCQ